MHLSLREKRGTHLLPTLALLVSLTPTLASSESAIEQLSRMSGTSVLMVSPTGEPAITHLPSTPRIPASTLKILIAWAALEHWGEEFRFRTDFFLEDNGTLVVKGYGDPFLVSEEIERIAGELALRLKAAPTAIRLDDSYFENVQIGGQTHTHNPYDAPVAALAANFNTAALHRTSDGIHSGEKQTPLTEAALELASTLPSSIGRISLRDRERGLRNFAEILRAKLEGHRITIKDQFSLGSPSAKANLLHRHFNSRPLKEVVRAMLRFSTNFIANQLYLALGADMQGAPATMAKSRASLASLALGAFPWKSVEIYEGAGLSKENQLTADQLIDLLSAYSKYYELLPEIEPGVHAKTGTLNGVRTLAGYIDSRAGQYRFAILINSNRHGSLREDVLRELITRARATNKADQRFRPARRQLPPA